MESFLIKHVNGDGGLEFFGRTPVDPAEPVERFSVRLTLAGLRVSTDVYACPGAIDPSNLFEAMANNGGGWAGERTRSALEGEVERGCSMDRQGHVAIRVALRPYGWTVEATIATEAGQLEEIARRARAFFGPRVAEAAGRG